MAPLHLLLLLLPHPSTALPPTTALLSPPAYPLTPAPAPAALPAHDDPTPAHGDTADDLISRRCGDIILLFARGTGNPGNIGTTLGPPLLAALRAGLAPHTVAAQGVLPYPASTLGYLRGGSREGVDSMVALTYLARRTCPDAALVLAGFSQGAQILRQTVRRLPAPLSRRVVAVLSFSDDQHPAPLPPPWDGKHLSLCQPGDWICDGRSSALTGRHHSALYLPFLGIVAEQLRGRLDRMRWEEGGGDGSVGGRG